MSRSAPEDAASGLTAPIADPTTPGPTFTVRRVLPFGIVVVLSALSPAVPHNITPIARWWILAWVMIALTAGACFLAARLPTGHWWHTATPLLLFPAIQMLRAADGFAASGFTPLIFLPVLWFALYGPLRDVVIGIAGAMIVVIWPIVLIGGARYPASSLRGSVLLLIVLASAAVLISTLVRSTRTAATRLSVSEQRFRAAFDDAPMGMALTGIRGTEFGHFLRVNRALCALFGRTAEELTSAPIESLTHPDDVADTRTWFSHATDLDVAHRFEKRYLHASGRVIWASVSFSVVRDDAGRPMHLITQIEDVSTRRQTDQALLDALESERAATEQMRALEAARSAVMSNAAHDLRTPLTSASGFTELLLEGSAGELTPTQHKLAETVSRSLSRLSGIVDELVATSRKHIDVAPTAREPFDLGAVLDGATHAMSIMSSMAGQTLHADNGLHGVAVEGDSGRIDRALGNLIGNAVKFTPAGGRVLIDGHVENDRAVITVRDTGIGIPTDEHQKIFDRYYRASATDGRTINGSGLGLAIVREIVSQHDGTVDVASEPGKGSTFTVTLPLLVS
jgi:PAS domain S-box-containing protein